jgi:hypothetical protein
MRGKNEREVQPKPEASDWQQSACMITSVA